jgi:hypothetical protein
MREEIGMTDETMFEAEITRALEVKPGVVVATDFAARVRAALPAQQPVRTQRFAGRSLGQTAAIVAAVGLVAALCLLVPNARPSFGSVAFDLEMVLFVELAFVTAWLGAGDRGRG